MDSTLLEDLLRFNLSDFLWTSAKDRPRFTLWLPYKPCFKQISWIKQQVRMPLLKKSTTLTFNYSVSQGIIQSSKGLVGSPS